jgi:hypothetical protein
MVFTKDSYCFKSIIPASLETRPIDIEKEQISTYDPDYSKDKISDDLVDQTFKLQDFRKVL